MGFGGGGMSSLLLRQEMRNKTPKTTKSSRSCFLSLQMWGVHGRDGAESARAGFMDLWIYGFMDLWIYGHHGAPLPTPHQKIPTKNEDLGDQTPQNRKPHPQNMGVHRWATGMGWVATPAGVGFRDLWAGGHHKISLSSCHAAK